MVIDPVESPAHSSRLGVGLIKASHPAPVVAVTVVMLVLAAALGRDLLGVILIGVAIFSGQLSVGWSNDAFDAPADRLAGRRDKPTVNGAVSAGLLWWLAGITLFLAVLVSYAASGPVGGSAHVVGLISAWLYNVGVKSTVFSIVPYAVSFGLLPAFVTLGLNPPLAPALWLTAAAALLGMGAHLANAIPDLASDRAIGTGGLAERLGERSATWLAVLLLTCAIALLAFQLAVPVWVSGALVAGTVLGAGVVVAVGRGRALFWFCLGLAVVAVVLLVLAGQASVPS